MDEAIAALRAAIENEGPHPEVHREVMARHRAEWPTLWTAIDALLADDGWPTEAEFHRKEQRERELDPDW